MPPPPSPPKPRFRVATPMCCRNGVKSEPDPSASMRRSARCRASRSERVVAPPAAVAAEAEVQGRDPDVRQERREVRAGSERVDAQIGPLPRLLPELGRGRLADGAQLGPLPRPGA